MSVLCATNPDLWFSDDPAETEQAQAICRTCPQRETCLMLSVTEVHGVWGGLSPEDREWLSPESHAEGVRLDDEWSERMDLFALENRPDSPLPLPSLAPPRPSAVELFESGMTRKQVAEELGISTWAVKALVQRARRKAREVDA